MGTPEVFHESSTVDDSPIVCPRIVEGVTGDALVERAALARGLLDSPAAIPPKYFYDALGCALFGAICELQEYYPTRTEQAIFDQQRAAIAHAIGAAAQFVDLGAGDCSKALAWLPVLAPSRYVAVDIARHAIARALSAMAPEFPRTQMQGVVTDFTRGLDLAHILAPGPTTFFYPGSSIGNFAPDAAVEFLRAIFRHVAGRDKSGLLIGVDTKKDPARLALAYDDAVGVTAAFNRNVLRNVNRILGSDFRPERFAHRGTYNEAAGRIEMHLEAMVSQWVQIDETRREFAAGECIHTENSYKYSPPEFTALLQRAGFADVACWQDENNDFAVYYAR